MDRTILHIDQNSFYASVECLYHPELRNIPMAVGGDAEQRHGIILAKNQLAKKCGVLTGEALWQAQQKCPKLVIVKPRFELYLRFSKLARQIYSQYTNQIESFGLDECWLDVSDGAKPADGKKIADELRKRVKFELGITASVGVSYNKIFAKLGSDYQKPDATTVITRENYRDIVWPLAVGELLYVGRATQSKLSRCGIDTIGDLARTNPRIIEQKLGKNGMMIWRFANGFDTSPVSAADDEVPVKSIGNSTTTPRDLVTDEDVRITLSILCESVAARLREHGLNCSTVQISVRDKDLYVYERQEKLEVPTCVSRVILNSAFSLYQRYHTGKPIRSIGVKACSLSSMELMQMSLLPEAVRMQKQNDLEYALDGIRCRFGNHAVRRGIALIDAGLSGLDPKKDHIIHPVAFLNGGKA